MCGFQAAWGQLAATIKTGTSTLMFSRGGFDAKTSRHRLPGTEAAGDALVALARDNPDKALVMKYIGQLVAHGYGELTMLDNGEAEIRFTTGETYLLAETTILRLA